MTDDPWHVSPSSQPFRPRDTWRLAPCLLVGPAGALVLFASVTSLAAPFWLALLAAIVVFPALPALWHVLAEREHPLQGPRRSYARFALRTLAIGLLVIAVALAALGPRNLVDGLGRALGFRKSERLSHRQESRQASPSVAPTQPIPHHELESFIPADASLVIALSDVAVIRRIVTAKESAIQKTWAALMKCQIQVDHALVLIAARDSKTRMIVVRAPGVTDQRNLYCLVGVLGSDKVNLQFSDGEQSSPARRATAEKDLIQLEIDALSSGPLQFEIVDSQTIVAADAGWKETLGRKLPTAQPGVAPVGILAAALDRIDRGAGLWSAGIVQTDGGWWDLAVEARFDGTNLDVRASSTPPSGVENRTTVEMRMPAEFASALPQVALTDGIRGLLGLIAAAGAGADPLDKGSPSPPRSPPTPGRR